MMAEPIAGIRYGAMWRLRYRLALTTGGLAVFVLLLFLSGLPGVRAAEPGVPTSRDAITLSFAPLVRQVAPAVVNVFAQTEVTQRSISPLFDDPFFRRFFGGPQRRSRQTLGSGVILDPGGLVATNHHVIANASKVKVVLSDRREFDATLLLADEKTDLAILEIDAGGAALPHVAMRDSDSVAVGDLVLAIGNPFGVGQTVTSGIVSALARTAIGITDYSFFIQTDAAINPGNSGGALISMDGRLIGINTAIYSGKQDGGSVGIGFAVPSNMVRTVLASARGGRLVRPWLGASGQTVTTELAGEFGLDRPHGVVINAVYPAGPADVAGLVIGDVVVAVDGRPVDDMNALQYRIATLPLGTVVTIAAVRGGREVRLSLALREPPVEPAPQVTDIDGKGPLAGARVANLSPAFAAEHGFDDMATGVVVLGVRRGSAAAESGLQKGDEVIEVNGDAIESVDSLIHAVASRYRVWRVAIRRGDRILKSEFRG